jgi:hypothetical protein
VGFGDGVFVPMEVLFLRLSFFEETTFYDNGFLQAFMAIGDFLTILKVGPAIFTECSGSPNVSKLNRVASPGPSTQPQPSTPPTPTNPFNDAVFTNSPVNFNDVRRANMALHDMIASGNPISSPAKKYITVGICRSLLRNITGSLSFAYLCL